MLKDNTTRVLRLIDHNAQFELNLNTLGTNPVILNKYNVANPEQLALLAEQVFSDGRGEEFVARCDCEATEGNNRLDMICPICGTPVKIRTMLDDDHLACKSWLSCPDDLRSGWLSPKIYLALSDWLAYDRGKSNYLDDILDVTTPIPYSLEGIVTGKGFQYLYDNFDRLIEYFATGHKEISRKHQTRAMLMCISMYRHQLFCRYIPILNSAVTPMMQLYSNKASQKKASDVTAEYVVRAATALSDLEYGKRHRNRGLMVEKIAYDAFKDIVEYTVKATEKLISKKKAIPRMHIYGSRFHYSVRAVIAPNTEIHSVDELHIPWKMGVNTLRVMICGRLCDEHGFVINAAYAKVRKALNQYDPLIASIMNRFIDETPFLGLPFLWHRAPSIRDGSVMMKFVTVIKDDLNDPTVSISPLDVAMPNADKSYQLTFQLSFQKETRDR